MRAVLLLSCPDRPGIVADVGRFVAAAGGNIVEADQHSDPEADLFLQRVEFDVATPLDELHAADDDRPVRLRARWSDMLGADSDDHPAARRQ